MYNEGKIITYDDPELNGWFSIDGTENVQKKSSSAKKLNLFTARDWFTRLKMLAVSRFEWENLPDDITSDWIEKELFQHGQLVFFESKQSPYGKYILPFDAEREENIYGEPMQLVARGKTSQTFSIDKRKDDFIILKDNILAYPTINVARLYAYRLVNVERTMDVNVQAQKKPFIIKGKETQIYSLINMTQQAFDNENFIVADKDLDVDDTFDVFNINAPYVADVLMVYKHEIINEFLTYIGLSNANTDKRERLIVDEVNANNEEIKISISQGLTQRQNFAKLVNEKFGTDISVSEKDLSIADFGLNLENMGGAKNEQVLNGATNSVND